MTSNTNTPPAIEKNAFDYTKLIPFATAGLILLGISKLIFFYSFFNIYILSYLEFSEIITSFLDVVTMFTMIGAATWVHFFLIKSDQKTLVDTPSIDEPSKEAFRKELKKIKIRKYISLAGLFVCVIALMITLNFKPFIIFSVIVGIAWLIFHFVDKLHVRHPSKMIKDFCIITKILIISETTIIFLAFMQYKSIYDDKKYLQATIVFKNEITFKDSSHVFISDRQNICMGQTKNYIFIHHKKDGVTSIYPRECVLKIDIQRDGSRGWMLKMLE